MSKPRNNRNLKYNTVKMPQHSITVHRQQPIAPQYIAPRKAEVRPYTHEEAVDDFRTVFVPIFFVSLGLLASLFVLLTLLVAMVSPSVYIVSP